MTLEDENQSQRAKRGEDREAGRKEETRLPSELIPFGPIPPDFLNISPKARPFSCLRSEQRRYTSVLLFSGLGQADRRFSRASRCP